MMTTSGNIVMKLHMSEDLLTAYLQGKGWRTSLAAKTALL